MRRSRNRLVGACALFASAGCSVLSSFDGFGGNTGDAGSTSRPPDGGGVTPVGPDAAGPGPGVDGGEDAGGAEGGLEDAPVSMMCPPPSSDAALLAYFRFEEGKGTKAIDCSGKGNDATLQGAAVFRAGKNGGGLHFNGTNACLDLGASKGVGLTAITIGAWMSVVDYASGTVPRYIVAKTTDQEMKGWRFATTTNGAFSTKIGRAAGGAFEAITAAGSPLNTWLHAAMVYTANGDVTLWVDGKKVKTAPAAPPIVEDTTAHLHVGCFASSTGAESAFFSGTLDELRIYSRALSDTEMEALPAL